MTPFGPEKRSIWIRNGPKANPAAPEPRVLREILIITCATPQRNVHFALQKRILFESGVKFYRQRHHSARECPVLPFWDNFGTSQRTRTTTKSIRLVHRPVFYDRKWMSPSPLSNGMTISAPDGPKEAILPQSGEGGVTEHRIFTKRSRPCDAKNR